MLPLSRVSPITSLVGFILGIPTLAATYYQAWKARKEAALARQGLIYSQNCLEFILDDGNSVNVIPLETLHTLPKPDDILFLPGDGFLTPSASGAFRVSRVEHIYARVEADSLLPRQARLAKVVAHIVPLYAAAARIHGARIDIQISDKLTLYASRLSVESRPRHPRPPPS